MIVKTEKLTEEDILQAIKDYEHSKEYARMKEYNEYYQAKNTDLKNRWVSRERRRQSPNWYVPTAYFSTVVDSMAGYMFQRISYECGNEAYQEAIHNVLDKNDSEVKDMISGTYALAFNRSYELIYTDGDNPQIRYATLHPLQCIPIYNDKIEPDLFGFIWKRKAANEDYDLIDVIYADEWQYWKHGNQEMKQREEPRQLYFPYVPVVQGRTEIIGDQSPFHIVIPYISALDWAITGNSNEIDRLVDALLLLGRRVKDEDLMHMDEWKLLEDIEKDELKPEYLTKNLSPEFRKYVTDLLINEIHKHSHVIDWYNPTGAAADASAKALKTRLFDMDMYSKRLEKVYIKAMYRRIDLIAHLLGILNGIERESVQITLNRTVPTDYESKMESLKGVDWYSTETKVELTGGNWDVEKARLEAEQPIVSLDEVQ